MLIIFNLGVCLAIVKYASSWGIPVENGPVLPSSLNATFNLEGDTEKISREMKPFASWKQYSQLNSPETGTTESSTDYYLSRDGNRSRTWKANSDIKGKTEKFEFADGSRHETSKEVLETQHATCRITTEELVATAQATVTRVLKGLCNSKEVEDRFHNLETMIGDQLNVLKTMILNNEEKLDQILQKGRGSIPAKRNCIPKKAEMVHSSAKYSYSSEDEEAPGSRDLEINKYNSTIQVLPGSSSGNPINAFTYFWKINNINNKLSNWKDGISQRSSSFYIYPRGYRMYLRIYPRKNGDNTFIHVGLTKGEFDDELHWPFKLKHQLSILEQTYTPDDIKSRIWDPQQLCSEFNWQKPVRGDNYECVGLGFPHADLKDGNYIRDDSIVVKLTVYLNQN